MPVPAPAGGILSFASPKESTQRKGDPDFARFLRFSLLPGGFGRAILGPPKTGGIHAATRWANSGKNCDARVKIRDKPSRALFCLLLR